jgi:hypothetical protein
MGVLPSTGDSRYHNCCRGGGTSLENIRYHLVIQLSVVVRSSGYAFVWQVIGLHEQYKDYLIVGRDAILYTTVVEEPAVFVYR